MQSFVHQVQTLCLASRLVPARWLPFRGQPGSMSALKAPRQMFHNGARRVGHRPVQANTVIDQEGIRQIVAQAHIGCTLPSQLLG